MDIRDATFALIDVGRFLFSRGWVPATSGNLSARLDDGTILVTVSGYHKGELNPEGLMVIDGDGRPLMRERRPSAETPLHLMIYRRFPEARAVLHTHSPMATVLSMGGYDLTFEGFEMLKALSTIESHERRLRLPVFPNDQNVARLAGPSRGTRGRDARLHDRRTRSVHVGRFGAFCSSAPRSH